MRAIGCFLLGVVAAVLVVAFGLFAMENGQVTQFSFLGNTMRMSLWLLVGIPAVIGFLMALLLVTPARAAVDRQGSMLRGQYRSLERELANQQQQNEQLHTENSRLQEQHQQLVAERDDLHSRMAAAQQAIAVPARETERETPEYNDTPTQTGREEAVAPMTPAAREEAAAPAASDRVPERPVTTEEPVAQREPAAPAATEDTAVQREPAQPAQPTLGERLRGVFGGPRTAEEEETERLNSRGPAPTM